MLSARLAAIAAFLTLLMAGTMAAQAEEIHYGLNIQVDEQTALITPANGIIIIPIYGENMTFDGQNLPNEVALFTDGETFYVLEVNGTEAYPIGEAPYEEGYVIVEGENMTLFEALESDGATAWLFELQDPLAILASPGECVVCSEGE